MLWTEIFVCRLDVRDTAELQRRRAQAQLLIEEAHGAPSHENRTHHEHQPVASTIFDHPLTSTSASTIWQDSHGEIHHGESTKSTTLDTAGHCSLNRHLADIAMLSSAGIGISQQ